MIKRNLALLSIVLISTLALAAGFKDYSWDEMRFGGSASGVRKIVFDQTPDGSSAELSVDPANEEFVLNNKVNVSNGLDVTGQLNVLSTTLGSKPCPAMTEAQRDAIASPSDGDCVYNTDAKALSTYDSNVSKWVSVGSGASGSGELSYIEGDNSDFENSVGDWVSYDDAPGEDPVDGTGAGATITCSRIEAADMLGSAHFRLSKDAADRQGEGCSLDFTIDETFSSSPEIFWRRFRFKTSANYVEGDVTVHLYDKTNNVLVAIYSPDSNTGNMVLKSEGTSYYRYQTKVGVTEYRAIFHISTVNNLAYDVDIDRIIEGPINLTNGYASTGWSESEVVTENWGNFTCEASYKQNGDSADIQYVCSANGNVPTGTLLNIGLPSGLSINESKVINSELNATGLATPGGVGIKVGASVLDADNIRVRYYRVEPGSGLSKEAVDLTNLTSSSIPVAGANRSWVSGNVVRFTVVSLPIVGWSTNTQYSQAFSNRDIVVEATMTSGTQALSSGSNTINFTASTDTASTFSSNTFTAPVSQVYFFYLHADSIGTTQTINWIGNAVCDFGTRRIFDHRSKMFDSTNTRFTGNGTIPLYVKAGETCTFTLETNGSTTLDDARLIIANNGSSQSLMETPVVSARYTSDNGQSLGTSATDLIYEDFDSDTMAGYNASTGEYTIKYDGYYTATASYRTSVITLSNSQRIDLSILVDGSSVKTSRTVGTGGNTNYFVQVIMSEKFLKAGQVVKTSGVSSVSTSLQTGGSWNEFSIKRSK